MITRLNNGDKVIFLDNILKDGTYGEKIIKEKSYYIRSKCDKYHGFLTEDEKLPIFKELYKLCRDSNTSLIYREIYYSYALVNDEYKLIMFGRDIFKLISKGTENKTLNVVIEKIAMFEDFKSSYFKKSVNKKITEDFLKTKTKYIEDIILSKKWTEEENYNILIEFFISYNIKSDPIKEITKKQRELKLQRVLKQNILDNSELKISYTETQIKDAIKEIGISFGYNIELKNI